MRMTGTGRMDASRKFDARHAWHREVCKNELEFSFAFDQRSASGIGTPFWEVLMTHSRSLLALLSFALLALSSGMNVTGAQEVDLVPVQNQVLASGHRAEALKLRPVLNDKRENIGRI